MVSLRKSDLQFRILAIRPYCYSQCFCSNVSGMLLKQKSHCFTTAVAYSSPYVHHFVLLNAPITADAWMLSNHFLKSHNAIALDSNSIFCDSIDYFFILLEFGSSVLKLFPYTSRSLGWHISRVSHISIILFFCMCFIINYFTGFISDI